MFRQLFLRGFSTTSFNFAGHSKWANIKHIKAQKDGQKAAMFTKYARQIRLKMQEGGSNNPQLNSSLKSIIDEALKKNMPMASIQNQLKKYNANSAQLKKQYLEIKAFNKIFIICEVYSENIPAVKMSISTILKKNSSAYNDISHLFNELGIIQTTNPDLKCSNNKEFEEICTEHAIEIGAEEVEDVDFTSKSVTYTCEPRELDKIKRSLMNLGYVIENSEHVFIPQTPIQLTAQELTAYNTLKEKLSNVDGVENIYDNVEQEEVS